MSARHWKLYLPTGRRTRAADLLYNHFASLTDSRILLQLPYCPWTYDIGLYLEVTTKRLCIGILSYRIELVNCKLQNLLCELEVAEKFVNRKFQNCICQLEFESLNSRLIGIPIATNFAFCTFIVLTFWNRNSKFGNWYLKLHWNRNLEFEIESGI